MAAVPQPSWTPSEYLAFERKSAERHEYLDGQLYAMAGASYNHNQIMGNVYGILYTQLRAKPCRVLPSDMRVKISQTGLYTYPDISVVCDEPQFDDAQTDTLLNPILLIEVLSPSTEAYDRGQKFRHYRTLGRLREYLLVSQDAVHIEHYSRQDDQHWLLTDVVGLEATLKLPAIDCILPLTDVYERVRFDRSEGLRTIDGTPQ